MYDYNYGKEAYHYRNYVPDLSGATVNFIEEPTYILSSTPSETLAYNFMQDAKIRAADDSFDALLKSRLKQSEDQIDLILGEIKNRDVLTYDNLHRLYDDLLRIDNWRNEIPYPQNYSKDNNWSDLNKSELQIRDQIRREMKDAHKDQAFPNKDLRESLLEFKLQNTKQDSIDDLINIEEMTPEDLLNQSNQPENENS